MQAIQELYKIGRGPSSSHTLAPERACKLFVKEFGPEDSYVVTLYGSLSFTGKGHSTDTIIKDSLPGKVDVVFGGEWKESFPNGILIESFDKDHQKQHHWTVFSLGGGSISIKEKKVPWNDEVYPEKSFAEIAKVLEEKDQTLIAYVLEKEPDLLTYLDGVLKVMLDSVDRGLADTSILPGRLQIPRHAKILYDQAKATKGPQQGRLFLMAYAYAASEENAAGHIVVTAPTLGACGVLASLMKYYSCQKKTSNEELCKSLIVAGVFGNLIKTNATISGAVGGCQAEIGAAVSMASAACAYLSDCSLYQVEYAAEIGMEHSLGLTCDPVEGYVMIPCIERNAMGVLRAYDGTLLAQYLKMKQNHLVSFDMVVQTMKETGNQLPVTLRETSEGGLAKVFEDEK